jgi:hypothetical protein
MLSSKLRASTSRLQLGARVQAQRLTMRRPFPHFQSQAALSRGKILQQALMIIHATLFLQQTFCCANRNTKNVRRCAANPAHSRPYPRLLLSPHVHASSLCTTFTRAVSAPRSREQSLHHAHASSLCTTLTRAVSAPRSREQSLHHAHASSLCTTFTRAVSARRLRLARQARRQRLECQPPVDTSQHVTMRMRACMCFCLYSYDLI